MGKRGPRPEPSILKYVKNARRANIRDDEPTPDLVDETIDPPDWLTDVEQQEWKNLVALLVKMRTFTEADVLIVALACTSIAEIKECRQKLAVAGSDHLYFETDEKGERKLKHSQPNSFSTRQRQAKKELLQCLRELGFTPSARTMISVGDSKPTNQLSSLLQRRSG
jgi:P27 family predicted phage terminase small subunit